MIAIGGRLFERRRSIRQADQYVDAGEVWRCCRCVQGFCPIEDGRRRWKLILTLEKVRREDGKTREDGA